MYLHQNISAKLTSTSSWSVGIGVIQYQHLKSYRETSMIALIDYTK